MRDRADLPVRSERTTGAAGRLLHGLSVLALVLLALAAAAVPARAATPASPAPLTSESGWPPHLHWKDMGAKYYRIYRNSTYLVQIAGTLTEWTESSSYAQTCTDYGVSQVNSSSVESAQVTIRVPAGCTKVLAPTAPTGLTGASPTRTYPTFSWTAVSGVTAYDVYANGTYWDTVTTTSYVDYFAWSPSTITYTVVATNSGGSSPASTSLAISFDKTPPSRPSTPVAAKTPTNGTPVITWNASTGTPVGYNVWRGSVLLGTTNASTRTWTDTTVKADGTYTYTVSSYDTLGNTSSKSRGRSIVVDRTAPGRVSLTSTARAAPTKPVVSWTALVDGKTTAKSYNVYRDGVKVGSTTTALTFTDSALVVEGGYGYTVAGLDAAGNEGAASLPVRLVWDATAPAAPTFLTGTSPTRTAPALSWVGPPDAVSYTVSRAGTVIARPTASTYTDAAVTAADGTYTYSVAAVDPAGNTSVSSIVLTVVYDTVAPPVPAGLAAPTRTRLAPALGWTVSTGAAAYRLYRDGALVASPAGTAVSDASVVADGTYAYAVSAVDAAGNESARSAVVTTIYDATPPAMPLHLIGLSPTRRSPILSWDAVADAAAYRIDRDGIEVGRVATRTFTDAGVAKDGTYAYTVRAVDAAGNESLPTGARKMVYDSTPPAIPAGVSGETPTNASPQIAWKPATDAASYTVYRDGVKVATALATAFSDSSLTDALAAAKPAVYSYSYTVSATDAAGNESAHSDAFAVDVDLRNVDVPALLDAPTPTNHAPSLRWRAVAAAASFVVYRDGVAVDRTAGTTWSDPAALVDGAYSYQIGAISSTGSEVERSSQRTIVVDTVPPVTPTGLTGDALTNAPPALSWKAVADAVSYRVYRNGAFVAETSLTDAIDDGTPGDDTYRYAVTAVDAAGNESSRSPVFVVGLLTAPPATPKGVTGTTPTRGAPSLTWSPSVGTADYDVYREGVLVGQVTTPGFTDAVLADGVHTYRIAAVDSLGNVSTASDPVGITVDTVAPGAPWALTAPSTTNAAPRLAWLAPDDAATYVVYRNDARVGTAATATFTDGSVGADGIYTYAVAAVDAAGNEGSRSATTAVTVDQTAPASPAAVTVASPSNVAAVVTWNTVAGAVSYRVYRDGALAGTTVIEGFADVAPAAEGTSTYAVAGVDAAGNESVRSPVVSFVYDVTAPGTPGLKAGASPTNGYPALSWTAVSGAATYNLYRSDIGLVGTVATLTFADKSVPADGSYTYTATAIDLAGNEGAASAGVAITVDTSAAAVPSGVDVTTPTNDPPALTWSAVTPSGSDAVLHYTVYRDGVAIGTTDAPSFTDNGLKADGAYAYTVTATTGAAGTAGTESARSTVVTVDYDATAPAVPAAPTGATPSRARPSLTWAPVPTAVLYDLYRDGALVVETAATTYVDPTVSGDGTYAYTVAAVDAVGNASTRSVALSYVWDTTAPPAPGTPTATTPTSGKPVIGWTAVPGASTYSVYRGADLIGSPTTTAFTDAALGADGAYGYRIAAVDVAGNASALSPTLTVTYDTTAPGAPTTVSSSSPTSGAPVVAWSAVADAAVYRVLRDGKTLTETRTTTATDTATLTDGTYLYAIEAVDGSGNVSAPSSPAVPVVVDRTAPAAPTGIVAVSPTNTTPHVSWNTVVDAASYTLWVDGAAVASTASTTATPSTIVDDGDHKIAVTATDAAGNTSVTSGAIAVVVDTAAPAAPTGLHGTSPTARTPVLDWTAVADAAEYIVYRDGTVAGTTKDVTFTDASPVADGAFVYAVVAVDAAGNASGRSIAATIVYDTTAPAIPAGLAAAATVTNRAPMLTWNGVSGAASFRVRRDGKEVGTATTPAFVDHALATEGRYVFTITAIDAVGNESAASAPLTVTLDLTPPAVPGPVSFTTPTNRAPALSWPAATGADTYRVYRDGRLIATSSARTFTEPTALADADFVYVIGAVDAAGNEAQTGKIVITEDGAPPPAPVLKAGPSPTNTSPAIAWSGVADAARYQVYRGGKQIAEVVGDATYLDNATLADSAYAYAVRAVDAAGNVGPSSNPVTVTVKTTAPGVPSNPVATTPTNAAPEVTWDAVDGTQTYLLWRDGEVIAKLDGLTYADADAGEGVHDYALSLIDAAGNQSDRSAVFTVEVDRTPPAVPEAFATSPTASDPVEIGWKAADDAATFHILLDDKVIATDVIGSSYLEHRPDDGTYTFGVVAVDAAGNESKPAALTVEVDTTPPDPTTISDAPSPTAGDPLITYKDVGAGSYEILRDAVVIGRTADTTYTDASRPGDGTYAYTVRVLDAAGNASDESAPAVVVVDRTAPEAPTGLVGPAITNTDVALRWDPVADASAYLVVRDGREVATTTEAVATDGAPDGDHVYTVRALDGAGNASTDAGTVRVVVDTAAPGRPDAPRAAQVGHRVDLSWPWPAGDAVDVIVYRDGTAIGHAADGTFTDDGVASHGHAYEIRLLDAAGNRSALSAATTVDVDATAPAVPTGVVGSGVSNGLPWIRWDASAGAVGYQVELDGVQLAWLPADQLELHAGAQLPDGVHPAAVRAIDVWGNASAFSAPVELTVDTRAPSSPEVTADSPTAGIPHVSWTPVPGAATYAVRRDGALVAVGAATTLDDPDATDGAHVYAVRAADAAGNVSIDGSVAVVRDTTAPDAPSLAAVATLTAASPELRLGSPAGAARLRLSRDGLTVATVDAATDGTLVPVVDAADDGVHAYRAVALDAVGNVSAPSDTVAVTVDSTPPAAPVVDGPALTRTAPLLTWPAVAGAATYEVRLDGLRIGLTDQTTFTSAQADGTFRFDVIAIDAAGNRSDPSDAVTVEVDATAPAAPTGLAVGSPITSGNPTLTWTAVAGAESYDVYRDGVSIANVSGTGATDTSVPGEDVFAYAVTAIDRAGNRSTRSRTVGVTVDRTPPPAPAALEGTTPTNAPIAVTWSPVAGAAGYRVRVGAAAVPVTAAAFAASAPTADGTYEVTVMAVDDAGNESDPAAVTIVVDASAPAAPTGLTADSPTRAAPALRWDAVAGATSYDVSRDGEPVATTSTPVLVELVTPLDGPHVYAVEAVDAAGNVSAAASVTVTVDTIAPDAPILDAVHTPTNARPVLSWAPVDGAASYTVRRDGDVVSRPEAATAYTDADAVAGAHAYIVTATDAAGNESAPSTPAAIVYKTAAPGVPGDLAATSPTRGDPALAWGAVDGADHFIVYRDGVRVGTPTAAGYTDTAADADGSFVYSVTAGDDAGNESGASSPVTVVVDRSAPAAPVVTAGPSPTAAAPSLAWASDPTAVGYRVTRDGTVALGATTDGAYTDDSADEGDHVYTVSAIDAAGNVSPASAVVAITVDRTAPAIAADVRVSPDPSRTAPTVRFSASAGASRYRVESDAVLETVTDTTAPLAPLQDDGDHVVTVTAIDAAGNEARASVPVSYTIDTIAPDRPVVTAPSPTRTAPLLDWPAVPGADRYVVRRDGVEIDTTATAGYRDRSAPADGDLVYTVTAIDAAGNASPASAGSTVALDTAAPGVPQLGPVVSPTNAAPHLSWAPVASATGYLVRRDGGEDTAIAGTSFDDVPGADGTYRYDVRAVDAAGNVSGASATAVVRYKTAAPGVPGGLTAATPTRLPLLSWSVVVGTDHYAVYRDGAVAGQAPTATFTDHGATDGTHSYRVAAVDDAGNESARSSPATVTVDTAAPAAPTALHGPSPTALEPAFDLTLPDDAVAYIVLRGGTEVATVPAGSAFADTVGTDGSYTYTATAVDAAGNRSASSVPLVIVYDQIGPEAPTGLVADRSLTNTEPGLTWTAVADAASYEVYRDGALLISVDNARLVDTTASEGNHVYRVRGIDAAGNASPSSTAVSVTVDRTPPAPPASIDGASPTRSNPEVTWATVAGAAAYHVYRGATRVAATGGQRFIESPAPADGTYIYTVVAVDDAGNESAPSPRATIVLDRVAPDGPVIGPATSPTNAFPAITWTGPDDAVSYRVTRTPGPATTVIGTSFRDTAATDGTFRYRVQAIDAAGNASGASADAVVVYRTAPPGVPGGLTAPSPTNAAPALTWTEVAGTDRYVVYRDGAEIARTPVSAYTDAASLADGAHAYAVAAVDDLGNESARSTSLVVSLDTVPPGRPTNLNGASPTRTAPSLAWTGGPGSTHTIVRRDGRDVADVAGGTWRDAGVADGTFTYAAVAVDAAGNRSAPSDTVDVELDTTAPDAPSGLAADRTPTPATPALTWDAVNGAAAYWLYRDGARLTRVTARSASDAAAGEGSHRYAVSAVDAAGNESLASAPITVEVDTTAPLAPVVTAVSPTRSAPALSWSPVDGAERYEVRRDAAILGSTAAGTFVDDAVGDGSWTYTVIAIDGAGNRSPASEPVTVVLDTADPDVPSPTADTPTRLQPTLNWPAVPGAATYRVERDGAVVADDPATVFTDTLTRDARVSYRVIAVDAAGNRSAPSDAVDVVYDTTPPAAPEGLDAPTRTRVAPALTWRPVADAVVYRLYRDGSRIGRSTDPSFADVDLADNGPHAYAVTALDAAGNESARSAPASVFFRAAAPGAVSGLHGDSPVATAPSLTWSALDNVQGYVVRRDGSVVGRVDAASFTEPSPLEDGPHTYTVAAVASGLEGDESDPFTVVVDTAAPDTAIDRAPDAVTAGDASVAFTLDADADHAQCRVDADPFRDCRSPYAVSGLPSGEHSIEVRAVDAAGNADPTPAAASWTVDATAPEVPTLTATPDTTLPLGSGKALVYVHVTAPADAPRVVVRRGDTVVLDGPARDIEESDLADSSDYTYSAVAYDAVGNASAPVTARAQTPDRTAPVTPAPPTGEGYPLRIRWTPEAGTTFSLTRGGTVIARTAHAEIADTDAADRTAPPAPAAPTLDVRSATALTVRWTAVDDRGTPYTYTVGGDDEAGNVGAPSSPADLLATSGLARYRVVVDGRLVTTTTETSADLTGLASRSEHRVTVIAVDAAGNDSDPSDAATAGSNVAPDAPTGLSGVSPTRTAPAITWAAVDGAVTYRVLRDGARVAEAPDTSFTDDALTADGSVAYTVVAIDANGLESPPSGPLTVVLDTTAPDTAITAGPGDRARSSVSFDLAPDEQGVTFACTLDDAASVACPDPWTIDGLAKGTHHVSIVATDAAGNVDPTPVTASFDVDLAPPAAPTLSAEADASVAAGSGRGRVTVTAAPGAGGSRVVVTEGARVVLDGAGGTTADDVADDVTLVYRAVTEDEVGNASDPVTVTVTTPDRTAPQAPVILGASGYPLRISWDGDPGVSADVTRDGTAIGTVSDHETTDPDATDEAAPTMPSGVLPTDIAKTGFTLDWSPAPDAGTPHTYVVTAVDAAGNRSDPTAPATVTVISGTVRYRVLVDDAPAVETATTSIDLTGFATGSRHRVRVVAVDGAGNESDATAPVEVQLATDVGTPPPSARIRLRPVYAKPGHPFTLSVLATPGVGTLTDITWSFDDGATATGAAVSHAFAASGVHRVTVTATDSGGGSATGVAAVVVDAGAPTIRVGGRLARGILVLATDDNSGIASLTASWGTRTRSLDPSRGIVTLPDGSWDVRLRAVDRTGNVAHATIHVVVDTHRPAIGVRGPVLTAADHVTVRIRVGDRGGVDRVTVDDKRSHQGLVSITTGVRHVVRAIDRAGNTRRITIIVARGDALAGFADPALDGPRGTDLWPSGRVEEGARLVLLRAVQSRLEALGYLPARAPLAERYAGTLKAAVTRFKRDAGVSERGIGQGAKAALDAATARRRHWLSS